MVIFSNYTFHISNHTYLSTRDCDKSGDSDGKGKWLKHATLTTVVVMSLFFLCYISYWSINVEVLIKYINHFYLKKQVGLNKFYRVFIERKLHVGITSCTDILTRSESSVC